MLGSYKAADKESPKFGMLWSRDNFGVSIGIDLEGEDRQLRMNVVIKARHNEIPSKKEALSGKCWFSTAVL